MNVCRPSAYSRRSTAFAIDDLPAPGSPVSHTTNGSLPLRSGARGAVDLVRLPGDVVRAAQREVQQAGADRVVRDAVDEDEAARVAVLRVRVEGDRLAQLDVDDADLVQLEVVRGDAVERVDVELVLDRRDRGRDRLRPDAHEIRAAAQERLLRHPDDRRLELVADLRGRVGGARSRRRG